MKNITVIVNNKEWNNERIIELLNKNDDAVIRALMLIYSFQTDAEKSNNNTSVLNGKGFNKYDAIKLAPFIKFYNDRNFLSKKQIEYVRKNIKKYSNQILLYMQNKQAV